MYEKVAIITKIWHRYRCYFTSMSNNTWYLIAVPNMNKITTFFSELSQQTFKLYENIAIITDSDEDGEDIGENNINQVQLMYDTSYDV